MKGFLFVTSKGAKVSKDGSQLVIDIGEKRSRVPLGAVSHVFIMGYVNVTVPVIRLLSTKGKFLFIMNKFGKLISVVYPEFLGSDNKFRLLQYAKFSNEEFKVQLTKNLLLQKLNNIVNVLSGLYVPSKMSMAPVMEWKESVEASILSASDNQSMLGIDGNMSRFLFSKLASFNESPFYFERRIYYPPEDPVNALLSLSYTVFYSVLHSVVISAGLDPYFGFFHIKRGRHAALCSDLLEIVRPFLTALVFRCLNDGFFEKDDFVKEKRGVYLKNEPLKVFLKYYTDVVIHNRDDSYFSQVNNYLKYLKEELKK
ncbi:CRISPR-associated endonuclease Cas1 [Desulfurobacterium sp.]